MRTIETEIDGQGRRIAVVVGRFNHPITRRLLDGCCAGLKEAGCSEVDVLWVPGAFEIPLTAQTAARTGRYDAIVALGAVIRGATAHFEYVSGALTDGIRQVGLETGVPIAFGVLTTENVEQALDRAAAPGEPGRNIGAEAAEVALEMAGLLAQVSDPS